MSTGSHVLTDVEVKSCAISAVVTRANGTIENRGIWSYRHRNSILHYTVNAWIKLKVWYWMMKERYDGRTSPK